MNPRDFNNPTFISLEDKDGHTLGEHDIVEFINTTNFKGNSEWVSGPMVEKDGPAGKYMSDEGHYKEFSHGEWQVTWDDCKHGFVLMGIGDNVKNWMREWWAGYVKFVRKGNYKESHIPEDQGGP